MIRETSFSWLLFVAIVLTACSAVADGTEFSLPRWLSSVPLPDNVVEQMSKPGTDVPEGFGMFSGIWGGEMRSSPYRVRHVIVVKWISTTGGCDVIYAWEGATTPFYGYFTTQNCVIRGSELIISGYGDLTAKYKYNKGRNELDVWITTYRGAVTGTLERLYAP